MNSSKKSFYEGVRKGIGATIIQKCPFCGREHVRASPVIRRGELQCRKCAREKGRVILEEVLKNGKLQKCYKHFMKRKVERGRIYYGR